MDSPSIFPLLSSPVTTASRSTDFLQSFGNPLSTGDFTLPCVRMIETTNSSRGVRIYHNYVRPHEALNGRTPAEAAGIEVKGENKWLTLIQNANKKKAKC